MKKIATIGLVLLFIGAIPISCNWQCLSSCGCGDYEVKDSTITSFGLRTTNSLNGDTDSTKVYPYDALYKTLYVDKMEFVAFQTSPANLFISTASACSPAPPKAVEHFQEIKIISLTDIALADANDHVLGGQNIADRFVIAHSNTNDFKGIDSFIKAAADIYFDDAFNIRLSKQPFKTTLLNLKISVLMSNGKTFEFDKRALNVN